MARFTSLIFLQLIALSIGASAQGITGLSEIGRTGVNRGYFNYTEPGDITIAINVWGNVRYPSLYVLRHNVGLDEVISYCGSSQETTLLSSRRRRSTIVQVSRETATGAREIIYEKDIREIVSAPDIPKMLNGDVVMVSVEESEPVYWRDLIPIASLGIATTNLILNIMRLNN